MGSLSSCTRRTRDWAGRTLMLSAGLLWKTTTWIEIRFPAAQCEGPSVFSRRTTPAGQWWSLQPCRATPCKCGGDARCLNWIDLTWPYFTELDLSWARLTLPDCTSPHLFWPYVISSYLTWPYNTWPDLAWHYVTSCLTRLNLRSRAMPSRPPGTTCSPSCHSTSWSSSGAWPTSTSCYCWSSR